ncbi:ABC transporter permease [Streptomyces sp. TS71-3]|uniref:ABC transporter permease n=1 Tax=Streptomyces sp. TS71-3 TaxID=2733862 RepID=UPI001AFF3C03|nr:ABC transporter permease [Streptomyces sp. TS71-3]GHJ35566.1 transport permease protein [Streptomyces sp. TS71-3]
MSATVSGAADRQAAPRRGAGLVWHQIRYEQLTFWRNPQSAFFTFVFPILIIVIFGGLFGGAEDSSFYYGGNALQYYVSTIAGMSVLSACYSQLAIVLATRRQNGILKRVRATPLPASVYFVGLLAHCVLVSFVDVLLILVVGRFYGLELPAASQWLPLVVSLALGAAAFCALGIAIASLIRNADAAPAVVQFILFPLLIISGTYVPIHGVIDTISGMLPVKPLNDALLTAFTSHTAGFRWHDCLTLLVWGVIASAVGIRRFRWDPRPE